MQIPPTGHVIDDHTGGTVLVQNVPTFRPPCRTGTSTKLVCLHADGELPGGDVCSVTTLADRLILTITGRALVTSEAVPRFTLDAPHGWRLQ